MLPWVKSQVELQEVEQLMMPIEVVFLDNHCKPDFQGGALMFLDAV